MGEIVQKRDLAVVTAEIITIRDRTQQMILDGSIEIGKRLCEAKEIVGHGGWGDYLRDKVEFSQSTANNLMRIYREYGDEQLMMGKPPKSQTFGNLSYSQAVALMQAPEEMREEIVTEHDMASTSVAQLKEIIRQKEEEAYRAAAEAGQARAEAEKAREAADTAQKRVEEQQKIVEAAESRIGQAEERLFTEREKREKEAERLREYEGKILKLEQEAGKLQRQAEEEIAGKVRAETEKRFEAAIRESRQREDQLRRKLEELSDTSAAEVNILFHQLKETIEKLTQAVGRMEEKDAEAAQKYRAAMVRFAEILKEKIGG